MNSGNTLKLPVSNMASKLIGSEILKISGEINKMKAAGEKIANFTVGDFNPGEFRIPKELQNFIVQAYQDGHTNYPPSMGTNELRAAIANFYKERLNSTYSPDEILIAGGSRPLIYATYLTLLDPGDSVIYSVPSWNNNHYCHLVGAKGISIRASKSNNYMPTVQDIQPHLSTASLLVLNSPLNPTGTMIDKASLSNICELVLKENEQRKKLNTKPLYLLYDQVYWLLTFGLKHEHPIEVLPDMREYTIYIDGASKGFAATGIRVGWSLGPSNIMAPMSNILGHIGAWAPKPEQQALAMYLRDNVALDSFLASFKSNIQNRLQLLFEGFESMQKDGLPVHCIEPQGGIYLTVQFKIQGKKTTQGEVISTDEHIRAFLLKEAKSAFVPFSAFGDKVQEGNFRISVGGVNVEDIHYALTQIRKGISTLV